MKKFVYALRGIPRQNPRQLLRGRLLDILNAAEVLEQVGSALIAHARDLIQRRTAHLFAAQLAFDRGEEGIKFAFFQNFVTHCGAAESDFVIFCNIACELIYGVQLCAFAHTCCDCTCHCCCVACAAPIDNCFFLNVLPP